MGFGTTLDIDWSRVVGITIRDSDDKKVCDCVGGEVVAYLKTHDVTCEVEAHAYRVMGVADGSYLIKMDTHPI